MAKMFPEEGAAANKFLGGEPEVEPKEGAALAGLVSDVKIFGVSFDSGFSSTTFSCSVPSTSTVAPVFASVVRM